MLIAFAYAQQTRQVRQPAPAPAPRGSGQQSGGQNNMDWLKAASTIQKDVLMPVTNLSTQIAQQAAMAGMMGGAMPGMMPGAAGAAGAGAGMGMARALSPQTIAAAGSATLDTSCLNPVLENLDDKLKELDVDKGKFKQGNCIKSPMSEAIYNGYLQNCVALTLIEPASQTSVCTLCTKDYEPNKLCIASIDGSKTSDGSNCYTCDYKSSSKQASDTSSRSARLDTVALFVILSGLFAYYF
jgi:hypothetical protein